jgi:hypothetical protein
MVMTDMLQKCDKILAPILIMKFRQSICIATRVLTSIKGGEADGWCGLVSTHESVLPFLCRSEVLNPELLASHKTFERSSEKSAVPISNHLRRSTETSDHSESNQKRRPELTRDVPQENWYRT